MLDDNLFFMVNLSKLVAVNEYLRERGDKHVCIVLDSIVKGFQTVLCNSKQKINHGNSRSRNCSSQWH